MHGSREVTANLMYYLRKYSFTPAVRSLEKPGPGLQLDDPVFSVGWDKEQAVFIWDSQLPEAYRLLLEYYIFPEKFMFFDVNLASGRSEITSRFELQLRFNRPLEFASKVTKETLRLNCVPITNLFECDSEPIYCDTENHEYLVQTNSPRSEHAEVFHVVEVSGKSTPDAAKVNYGPFCSLKQAGKKRAKKLFQERREFNPLGNLDVYIKLHATDKDEILNLKLLCTNRALAGRIKMEDIGGNDKGSTDITYKNIIDASRPVLPPLERNLWNILGTCSLNHQVFENAQTLKEVLDLFNFQTSVDESIGEANRRRVESIVSVETQKRRQVIKQLPRTGTRTRIQIEEQNFMGHGDIFLFGCVLSKILASPYTPSGFSELIFILRSSNTEMKLGGELGTRPMM